jgi:ATP-dependent Lon protease
VLKFDTVAFDEVAGSHFKSDNDRTMYQGYMEQGSFSRGDDKGTLSGDAAIVFNGNFEGDIETTARISHLFKDLPDSIRNRAAFHDRWHAYLPGWEMPKMQPAYFTAHMGFIVDYVAEIFHTQLRSRNYTDAYDRHFSLGSHVEERDRKAIAKSVSGLMKLVHPNGDATREEIEEYLSFAGELRRRVKEQLKRMGGLEFAKVNLSYIDKTTGQETFVSCRELGALQLIPDGPLVPGDVFTVGFDSDEDRYSVYRLQVTATPGPRRFNVVGSTGKGIKESARMAHDYLKANASRVGVDRDVSSYDINVQVMSLMQGRDASDLGVAFFVSLISALLGRAVSGGLIILGNMSIHGVLARVEGLAEKLRVAMDAGARRVIIPTENRRDFADIPAEVIDKLQMDFYSDPAQAALKALVEN